MNHIGGFLWKQSLTDPAVIAKEIGRRTGAVEKKIERLSSSPHLQTTTTVLLSKDLLTHEEALKLLAGALDNLRKSAEGKGERQEVETPINELA